MTTQDLLHNPKSIIIRHKNFLSHIHNLSAVTGVYDRNNVASGFYYNIKSFLTLAQSQSANFG